MANDAITRYQPTFLYHAGSFKPQQHLCVDAQGLFAESKLSAEGSSPVVALKGRALLPGFVNVHSHSFQRLIRGKAESRVTSGNDFWSWRGTMYHAAATLSPEDLYDVARMTFLEMVKAGTTTVGEFHYLHTAPDGTPYDDPNLLSRKVIEAARSVGIRIVLLRAAYLRSGYNVPVDPGQTRFFETAQTFCRNTEALVDAYADASEVRFGVAPHSIRAVPLQAIHAVADWARARSLPIHMHVSEQVAENVACLKEYGQTPIALLHHEGLLRSDFTAVHAIHITQDEIAMFAQAQATICSCPTTERNLGDGIVAAGDAMQSAIPFALGSDSQAQIDPLEDARELDYHLRLSQQQRAILDQIDGGALSQRLFTCATANGARSLKLNAGTFAPETMADFISVDLNDPSIAGNSEADLLSTLVFGMNRSAVRDVWVNGRQILADGKHALEEEIIQRYQQLHNRVWHGATPSGISA